MKKINKLETQKTGLKNGSETQKTGLKNGSETQKTGLKGVPFDVMQNKREKKADSDLILTSSEIASLRGNHTHIDPTVLEIVKNGKVKIQHIPPENQIDSDKFLKITSSDYENFRTIKMDGPKSDYFSRKYEFKYVTHWGQLKLLLSEIEFLTIAMKTLDLKKKFVFIYAGAATGDHIPYLRDLFPSIEFLLYDPAEFSIIESERIKIINDYFFDATAKELAEKYKDYNILFCSDIRTEDSSDTTTVVNTTDADIIENMKMQFNWYRIINPDLSMFKFRLPFNDDKSLYPQGTIYTQCYCGPTSTETRLIVKKDAPDIYYSNKDYEQLLFYHNTVNRKHGYDFIGSLDLKNNDVCNCYDCASFLMIAEQYEQLNTTSDSASDATSGSSASDSMNDTRSSEPKLKLLKKIKEIIYNTNKIKPRTLFEQTKKQFIKQWSHVVSHYLNKKYIKKNTQQNRANTNTFKKRNNAFD